jgi:hypothetical protein
MTNVKGSIQRLHHSKVVHITLQIALVILATVLRITTFSVLIKQSTLINILFLAALAIAVITIPRFIFHLKYKHALVIYALILAFWLLIAPLFLLVGL